MARAAVSETCLGTGGSSSKLIHVAVGKDLPFGPVHRAMHDVVSSNTVMRQGVGVGESNWELQSSYNLICEVANHHFCGILFVGSQSLSPACTQEEGR